MQKTTIMASERLIAANRCNALHTTGPRTPTGKLVVAGNGLCHGILAEHGGPEPMDGNVAVEREQPPEPAHLATIGFASQPGSNAAAAQPSVAAGKDAQG